MVPWKSADVFMLGTPEAGRHIVYKKKQQTMKTASASARTGLAMAIMVIAVLYSLTSPKGLRPQVRVYLERMMSKNE